MKTIGLLGGMSWESTVIYYKAINESIRDKLGGLHSAKITMCSVDFEELEKLQRQNKWSEIATVLSNSAKLIESGGADFLLMCVNTMHKVASEVESSVSIPLVHIADATGSKLVADDIKKVGLLGTRFTMGESFYKQRIINKFGIDVIVPDIDAQDT
ncbi:aspartate/glutamate racemase family protein, partial [Vibrio harveyi]